MVCQSSTRAVPTKKNGSEVFVEQRTARRSLWACAPQWATAGRPASTTLTAGAIGVCGEQGRCVPAKGVKADEDKLGRAAVALVTGHCQLTCRSDDDCSGKCGKCASILGGLGICEMPEAAEVAKEGTEEAKEKARRDTYLFAGRHRSRRSCKPYYPTGGNCGNCNNGNNGCTTLAQLYNVANTCYYCSADYTYCQACK